jgi:hypothetical protein
MATTAQRPGVPTANPTLVTIICESADYRCDERLVQLDLVRSGRPGPVTGDAASRNSGPATPAQCVAAQIAQAHGTRQYRPRSANRPRSPGTQGARGIENHHSGNGDPLASRWFSSLLALQIPSSQWSAKDIRRDSPAGSGDEPRQSVLGRTAHPRRVTQARYRRRPDDRGKIHGEERAAAVTGLEDVSSLPMPSRRSTCSSSRRFRFNCCMDF